MFNFSEKSNERLATCVEPLADIMREVLKISSVDFAIVCGYRDEVSQMIAFQEGKSTKKWPDSKHNIWPSPAVDFVPIINGKSRWDLPLPFYFIAGMAIGVAKSHGIVLRWGGDWDRDLDTNDQTFNDLPHLEVVCQDS